MDREGRNRRKRRGRERAVAAAVAAAAAAVTATGGTKGGKGEILLTYTPTSGGPRAARPANAGCAGKGTTTAAVRYFPRSARAKGTVTIFCSFEGI